MITKDLLKEGYTFTWIQCEQKWKNITKVYRDTIDHNNKTGNDRKECPFFKELDEIMVFDQMFGQYSLWDLKNAPEMMQKMMICPKEALDLLRQLKNRNVQKKKGNEGNLKMMQL